jgi:hypothetical protein
VVSAVVRADFSACRGSSRSDEPASKSWSCHAEPIVRIRLPPAARLRTIIPSVTGVGWSIPLSLILSPGVSILSGVGAGHHLMSFDEEQVG